MVDFRDRDIKTQKLGKKNYNILGNSFYIFKTYMAHILPKDWTLECNNILCIFDLFLHPPQGKGAVWIK